MVSQGVGGECTDHLGLFRICGNSVSRKSTRGKRRKRKEEEMDEETEETLIIRMEVSGTESMDRERELTVM